MKEYQYFGEVFRSKENLDIGVLRVKNALETEPTKYAQVERVTTAADGGFVLEGVFLSDAGINNLEDGALYCVSSRITGETCLGLTKQETEQKLSEMRLAYAKFMQVNTVLVTEEITPDAADMSQFLV